jgi:dihydroflavonol-4-reductase
MSKILVTGGTGLVGAHLLYQLVTQGLKPIAIKRDNSDTNQVKELFSYYSENYKELFKNIEWKNCDVLDVTQIDYLLNGVNQIYHCAALVSFNSKLKDEMLETNYTGTKNIIDMALKNNVSRICYVSSIATLGSNNDMAVNEDCYWSWDNKSSYAVSKYLGETEVWRGFAEGLSGFIVNPSLIIGPGFKNSSISKIINMSKYGSPLYPPGSCGIIDVRDLVSIMDKLMQSDITNERFIINSHHITYKELMSLISVMFNKPKPKIKIGSFLINCLLLLYILIQKIIGQKIELSLDAIKYTTSDILLDSSKINEYQSFNYRDYTKTIEESVELFIKNNY